MEVLWTVYQIEPLLTASIWSPYKAEHFCQDLLRNSRNRRPVTAASIVKHASELMLISCLLTLLAIELYPGHTPQILVSSQAGQRVFTCNMPELQKIRMIESLRAGRGSAFAMYGSALPKA